MRVSCSMAGWKFSMVLFLVYGVLLLLLGVPPCVMSSSSSSSSSASSSTSTAPSTGTPQKSWFSIRNRNQKKNTSSSTDDADSNESNVKTTKQETKNPKRIASLFDLYHYSDDTKNETSSPTTTTTNNNNDESKNPKIDDNNDNNNNNHKKGRNWKIKKNDKKRKDEQKDKTSFQKEEEEEDTPTDRATRITTNTTTTTTTDNNTIPLSLSSTKADVNGTTPLTSGTSSIPNTDANNTRHNDIDKTSNSTSTSSSSEQEEQPTVNPSVIVLSPQSYQHRMPSSPQIISPYHRSFYQSSSPRNRRPAATNAAPGRKGLSNTPTHSTANMLLSALFGYPMDTTSAIASVLSLLTRLALVSWLSHLGHNRHDAYSPNPSQHFMFERLNDRYNKDHIAMTKALAHNPPFTRRKIDFQKRRRQTYKSLTPQQQQQLKTTPLKDMYRSTVIVMNIKDDTPLEYLRDAVSFLLTQFHTIRTDFGQELEIVICLESPGGSVTKYGLAANQIARFTQNDTDQIKLTVCVDQIAASGGYMMACQASKGQLIAAPFAMVGSIGVYRESLNIHDVLKKYGVQPLLFTAGESKVPISTTAKVTKAGMDHVQKKLEDTHIAFQSMVTSSPRRITDNTNNDNNDNDHNNNNNNNKAVEKVSTGQVFFGQEALELGLIDQIQTSDEYIYSKIRTGHRVLKLHKYDKSLRSGLRLSPLDLLFLQLPKGMAKLVQKAQIMGNIQPWIMQLGGFWAFCQILLRNIHPTIQAQYYDNDTP